MLRGELSETPGISRDFLYKLPDMTSVFNGTGPVFEAANSAFSALFEGSGVSRVMSKARHWLIDNYEVNPDDAVDIVHAVKNSVFDPLAADGAKPELDPTFKKYIHLFPCVLEYLFRTILGNCNGIGNTEKTRLSMFGEAFRNYLRQLPGNEVPETLEQWRLGRIDHDGSALTSRNSSGDRGYKILRPKSSEELVSALAEIGATDVPWCIQDESHWDTYSNHGKSTFYLLYNSSMDKSNPLSVLGVFVTESGYISHSFNRVNNSVTRTETAGIMQSCGIDVAMPGDMNAAIDLVNDGVYDMDDIVDDMEEIGYNMYLATSETENLSNVLRMEKKHDYSIKYYPIFPKWLPKDKIHVNYDNYIAYDDTTIYSLDGYELHHAPEGFTFGDDAGDYGDCGLICLRRGNATVNIFDTKSGHTLLAIDSSIPFDDSDMRFWAETSGKESELESPSIDFRDPRSYWTLFADRQYKKIESSKRPICLGSKTAYVVNKPGVNLADCPKITAPDDFCVRNVSKDARSYVIERKNNGTDYWHASYLICDGKPVNDKGMSSIDYDGDDSWTLYPEPHSYDKYLIYNTNTGELTDKT